MNAQRTCCRLRAAYLGWPAKAVSIQASRVHRARGTCGGVQRFPRQLLHSPFPHAAEPRRNLQSKLILSRRSAGATSWRPDSSPKVIRRPSNSADAEMIRQAGWREFAALPFARPPAASAASMALPAGLGKSLNCWSGEAPSYPPRTTSTGSRRRLRAFRVSFCRPSSQGRSTRTRSIGVQDRLRIRMNALKF